MKRVAVLSFMLAVGACAPNTQTKPQAVTKPTAVKTPGKQDNKPAESNIDAKNSEILDLDKTCDVSKPQFSGTKPQCVLVPKTCKDLISGTGFGVLNLASADKIMPGFMQDCEAELKSISGDTSTTQKQTDPNAKLDWAQCGSASVCEIVQKTPSEIEALIPQEVKTEMEKYTDQLEQ